MAAIGYWSILEAIKAQLDSELASQPHVPAVVIERAFIPKVCWVSINLDRRDYLNENQEIAAGKSARARLRIAVFSFYQAPNPDQAFRLSIGLTAAVELALLKTPTFGGLVNSSWLEGGEFFQVEGQTSAGTIIGTETILNAEADLTY